MSYWSSAGPVEDAIREAELAVARAKAQTSVRARAEQAWSELDPAPVRHGPPYDDFVGPPEPASIRRVGLQRTDYRPIGLMAGGAASTAVGFFARAMLPVAASAGLMGLGALGLVSGLAWGLTKGFKR